MKRGFTLLLAEDSEDDIFFFEQALKASAERAGVPVRLEITRDGEEALAYLNGEGTFADREKHPFPQIVVTDLKMPRLNGLDVLAWLKEHDDYQRVPKILLSGSLLRRKAGCKLLQTESQRCPSCWATSASISATCTVRRNAKDESRRAEGTGHAGSVAR